MIVLDTMVLSEMAKTNTNQSLRHWLNQYAPTSLFMTSISRFEMLQGIGLMPVGAKRTQLELSVLRVIAGLSNRSLPFDDASQEQLRALTRGPEPANKPPSNLPTESDNIRYV
jgi:predicted nucleic acid-binding protein